MNHDPELMISLSIEELEALAGCMLAPALQARLDDLLERRREKPLSNSESEELDRLLQHADQLTILMTRARYTLRQASVEAVGS